MSDVRIPSDGDSRDDVISHESSVSLALTATNHTTEATPPRFSEMSLIQTVILSVMFLVAFIGNVVTLMYIYRGRRPLSSTNLLIGHLAVSDLIVSFFCNVTEAVWYSTIQW